MSPRFVNPAMHVNRRSPFDPGIVALLAALIALLLLILLTGLLELGFHARVADLFSPLLRSMQITIFTN